MVDSCDNCFYMRQVASVPHCCFDAPAVVGTATPDSDLVRWKALDPVNSPYWCGQGADISSGRSFQAPVNQLPSGPAGAPGAQGPPGKHTIVSRRGVVPGLGSITGAVRGF